MLDNLNKQLWFLPAMFLTYLLFWALVKTSKKKRVILICIYLGINIATSFLPFLLPWNLDTVFITSILMYFGYYIKKYIGFVETLSVRAILKTRILLSIFCMMTVYFVAVKINGSINTSIRIFGDHMVFSIVLYILIGCIGSFAYIMAFAVCENTRFLRMIADCFEYMGHRTMGLLGTHMAIFQIINMASESVGLSNKYAISACKIVIATVFGIVFSNVSDKLSRHFRLQRSRSGSVSHQQP